MTPDDFKAAVEHTWPSAEWIVAPGTMRECYECFFGLDANERAALSDEDRQAWEEGSFSWSPCGSCGSQLGGNRYPAHAIHREAFGPDAVRLDGVHHVDICGDCLSWHANGDLPETWGG